MQSRTSYRLLAGIFGGLLILSGLLLTASFFGYQQPNTTPGIPTGPVGFYFVAFAGCALIGWGGGLMGVARNPEANRAVVTATVTALVLMSVVRMMAWVIGDYHVWLGELPRIEAGLFLLIAAAFLWLRPPVDQAAE